MMMLWAGLSLYPYSFGSLLARVSDAVFETCIATDRINVIVGPVM